MSAQPSAAQVHVASTRSSIRRPARAALVAAALLGLALVVLAFTYPAYEGLRTEGGVTTETTATLVEINGPGVLVPVLVPLAVTALVAAALTRAPQPAGPIVAWVLVGLLFAFAVLAMFSIGLYVLPVVVALAIATAWPRGVEPRHEAALS